MCNIMSTGTLNIDVCHYVMVYGVLLEILWFIQADSFLFS